jgi:hypothetical protein
MIISICISDVNGENQNRIQKKTQTCVVCYITQMIQGNSIKQEQSFFKENGSENQKDKGHMFSLICED